VRETLRYAAATQLPAGVGRRRKRARAEEVLRMLGLRDCADGVVGGALLKGISGGEKRRLSLACQMVRGRGCGAGPSGADADAEDAD
jgi:ABC-type multidrug transport system ATPase subunit